MVERVASPYTGAVNRAPPSCLWAGPWGVAAPAGLFLCLTLLLHNICTIYATCKHKLLWNCAKVGKSWSVEVSVERLRGLRRRRVMSISDLSEVSGVHRNTIRRIEQGKPAHTTTIRKLAKALGVEPGELVEPERRGED